ncbi:NAD(P)-dependent oxidoreductase [Egbenema bharatensis]|uniref:NAD(P)-dependent oxidoreductase n=1 Tax=Egbenema bharatensis TaxID=3463334 RepID=UPI003A87CDA4
MKGKVGLIGTGLMGLPMAQRLIAAEIPLVVYNRTPEKLEPLRSTGAIITDTVVDFVQQSHPVITMLTNGDAIQATLLSDAVRPHLSDRTVIQMGTIAPSESRQIQDAVRQAGGDYLEAPVLGSIPEVEAGKLQVMVGATSEQFQQWLPLLQHFGKPMHIGEVGAASALKLSLNQLIGSLTTAFALSLSFLQSQGGDVDTFMEILRDSALYAPTFDKKLQRMLDHHYANPNFPTKHLLKDMNLFLQEATAAGLRADSLEGVRQILEAACATELAEEDYSALFEAVRGQSVQ